MNREEKLQVKDLTISFRTSAGKVQAVRDISFDLYKGETLAIVGESGSGKSVTSRAILGISAANAMIESGEILYDGQDLLRISEEDFHRIRGDKIAMVFQDPLSSLNPIMRIGRQLTEAMLLKNKASRRECRHSYALRLKYFEESLSRAGYAAQKDRFADLSRVMRLQAQMQGPYDNAAANAGAALREAEDLLLRLEKRQPGNLAADCRELRAYAAKSCDRFVVHNDEKKLRELLAGLNREAAQAARTEKTDALSRRLGVLRDILSAALERGKPDFFALACRRAFEDDAIPSGGAEAINALCAGQRDGPFMTELRAAADAAVRESFGRALTAKKSAVEKLRDGAQTLRREDLSRSDAEKTAAALTAAVEASIDKLETVKDSLSYTFGVSLRSAVAACYDSERKNAREQKRFDAQTRKWKRQTTRGREPDWKVAPLSLADKSALRQSMAKIAEGMAEHFGEQIAAAPGEDFSARAEALLDWLRQTALGRIHKITPSMAKDAAIRLMESVGISEPRKRYRQYPFEFSGGMRQRIVIAISLTASPDVLICDEPTTALDVTIQAQILELINDLKKQRDLSVIFITHDLGVVANMADRVAVMYAGKIVEYGTSDDIFYHPAHPYTWALLASVPDLATSERLEYIPGTPPNMIYPPEGDAFAARNKYAMQIDFEAQPPMFRISDTHYAATWLLHPDAPQVAPPKIVTDRIRRMTGKGGADHE